MAVHETILTAVEARITAGRDVLVRGDAGSGKSTVLAAVVAGAKAIGRPVVELHGVSAARDLPLGLFHSSPEFLAAAEGRTNLASASAWLQSMLAPSRGLIVVDDAAYVDPASLTLIAAATRRTTARLIFAQPSAAGEALTISRELGMSFSNVHVEPLGIRRVSELLTEHSGGPVDASFIADITTWAAGNPRVVLTLFDAGVRTGAIQRFDGVWVNTSALDEFPLDDIEPAYLAALSDSDGAALRRLAWVGAIPLQSAQAAIGVDAVRSLTRSGRVVTSPRDPALTVVVTPPALARALLAGLSPLERAEIARAAEDALDGAEPRPALATTEIGPDWWQLAEGELPAGELPDSITFLTERLQSRVAALWLEWLNTRNVTRALPLLRVLMVYAADPTQPGRIFADTHLESSDDPEDVAAFLILDHQWKLWTGQITDDTAPQLPTDWDAGEWATSINYALMDLLRPLRGGTPVGEVVDTLSGEPPPGLHNTVQLLRAEAALERGAPGEADSEATAVRPSRGPSDLLDRLDAVRGDALLARGAVAEATAWFRRHLAAGYDAGDPFTVKIHARGLATARLLAGDGTGAWRAVSAALRIGRPGALSAALDGRVLGLAAVLSARQGELKLADRFIDELRHLPPLVRPRMDFMLDWGNAERLYAATPEDPEATELLWTAGTNQLSRGEVLPALICWSLVAAPLTAAQLHELQATRDLVDAPVLDPALRVHRAIHERDPERILRALRRFTVGGPLERCALKVAGEAWEERTGTSPTMTDVESASDARVATRWRQYTAQPAADGGALTDREREVLELARAGRSNREIAESLYLSVRTVENHMYRARQKTGLGRANLTAETSIIGRQ